MNTNKQSVLKLQGRVIDTLPGTMFRVAVEVDSGTHELIGYISGKMKMHYIKLLKGDLVDVEVSPHDLTKGRITYRYKS